MKGSSPDSPLDIFSFSTLDYPERDRFHVWVQGSHCDCKLEADEVLGFAATASGADLGSFILTGRKWLNRSPDSAYEIQRTTSRIRADGQDFFRFQLVLCGRLLCRQTASEPIKAAGDLFLLDAAQANVWSVEADNVLSLVIPRDLLPSQAERLHGETLSGAIGLLLADHLRSLFTNLSDLRNYEVPHVAQATLQLLTAAVSPTSDALHQAERPIHDALGHRVRRHIDMHLLDPHLSPERICRDVGLSRAKLYQLFDGSGGVMRLIQRKRLQKAYHVFADPRRHRPRVSEIAWQHGFTNEKYFHRLFKAEFGHTPLETLDSIVEAGRLMPKHIVSKTHKSDAFLPGWTLPFGMPSN